MDWHSIRVTIGIAWFRTQSVLTTLAIFASVGLVAFGAWSFFDSVLATVLHNSELIESVPQQNILPMTHMDAIVVMAAGLVAFQILSWYQSRPSY